MHLHGDGYRVSWALQPAVYPTANYQLTGHWKNFCGNSSPGSPQSRHGVGKTGKGRSPH